VCLESLPLSRDDRVNEYIVHRVAKDHRAESRVQRHEIATAGVDLYIHSTKENVPRKDREKRVRQRGD
jgi:hypothetical protein